MPPSYPPRRAPRHALVLGIALASAGCHARLRALAPTIPGVDAEAFATVAPQVDLGRMARPDLAMSAVGAWQLAEEDRVEAWLLRTVDPVRAADALSHGFLDALGQGPPFPAARGAAWVVQLELTDATFELSNPGAPGRLAYGLRVDLYDPDGRRVYRTRLSCTSVGAPREVERPIAAITDAWRLDGMRPEDLHAATDGLVEWCGWLAARRLRKHAGGG